jgi:hypothetical protein
MSAHKGEFADQPDADLKQRLDSREFSNRRVARFLADHGQAEWPASATAEASAHTLVVPFSALFGEAFKIPLAARQVPAIGWGTAVR